ncbi:MAG TPA: hypothetical protein VGK17_12610, partial [Propionicimonas sp.]
MDVLNPSPAVALPQTMWLTYKVIMKMPGLDQDKVLSLVVPDAMRAGTSGNGAHATQALDALREFRLVISDQFGGLSVEAVLDAPEAFLRVLRRRLVVPPSSIAPDFVGAPDLRSGLVWLLRQSPAVPLHWGNVQTMIPKGPFVNDTRWNTFRLWSQSLGFSRPSLASLAKAADQKATIVPDPTDAVLDALLHPDGTRLPAGESLPIGRLLDFLREELPVLPGSPSAIYEGMDSDDRALHVLGLALSSAEQRDVLGMSYQSD